MEIDLKKLVGSKRTRALADALARRANGRAQWTRQFAAAGKTKVGKPI